MTNDDRARVLSRIPLDRSAKGGRRGRDNRNPVGEPHIGKALRSVYDQTVGETIPKEMLDLLGRLD